MKKEIAKKTIILYILKLLYKASSFDKPIKIKQITNVLNNIGVTCDRRTVSRNIQYLIDFGLPVIRKIGKYGGYFYNKELDKIFN